MNFDHPKKCFHLHQLASFQSVGQHWSRADHFGDDEMFVLKHLRWAIGRHSGSPFSLFLSRYVNPAAIASGDANSAAGRTVSFLFLLVIYLVAPCLIL